jgi:hypothetical protein
MDESSKQYMALGGFSKAGSGCLVQIPKVF